MSNKITYNARELNILKETTIRSLDDPAIFDGVANKLNISNVALSVLQEKVYTDLSPLTQISAKNKITYSEEDLTILKEAAKVTLSDDMGVFYLCDDMGDSEEVLHDLLKKIHADLSPLARVTISNETIYSEDEFTILKEAARMALGVSDTILSHILAIIQADLDYNSQGTKLTYSTAAQIMIKESARVTFADADSVDDLADKLDISDTALMRLAEKVQADLDGTTPTESRHDALIREVLLLSGDDSFVDRLRKAVNAERQEIAMVYDASDVIDALSDDDDSEELTKEQAYSVLVAVGKDFDIERGITVETLKNEADYQTSRSPSF